MSAEHIIERLRQNDERRSTAAMAEGLIAAFPPTPGQVDYDRLLWLARELLFAIGYDPTDPAISDTPRRWASWWREFIEYDPGSLGTTFESVSTDQMVAVSGIRVWSLCEHHLLPFWCDLTIAYIADDKVLGLSKFARIAHQAAHRLQLQERLTHQIADSVEQLTGSPDVAVIGRGEHLCMTMRGIQTPAIMTSSVMRGRFRELPALRAELISLTR